MSDLQLSYLFFLFQNVKIQQKQSYFVKLIILNVYETHPKKNVISEAQIEYHLSLS